MGGWSPISPGRPIPGTGQNIVIGAASVQSTALGTNTQMVQISATGSCHVEIGPNPTATSASMLVKNTDPPLVIRVGAGEKLAAIQDGASTGNLNIVEWTH